MVYSTGCDRRMYRNFIVLQVIVTEYQHHDTAA